MRREHKHYTECIECNSKHISSVTMKCPDMFFEPIRELIVDEYWVGYICESCGYSHAESELVKG